MLMRFFPFLMNKIKKRRKYISQNSETLNYLSFYKKNVNLSYFFHNKDATGDQTVNCI